jgi:hypothetical protein
MVIIIHFQVGPAIGNYMQQVKLHGMVTVMGVEGALFQLTNPLGVMLVKHIRLQRLRVETRGI